MRTENGGENRPVRKISGLPGLPGMQEHQTPRGADAGALPQVRQWILKRKSKKGYAYYACERGAECGFMTWDVPTAEDCPECGQTLFKKSGKGRMKPFCINEKCSRFLPEDQRGYYKKKTAEDGEATPEEKPAEKKTAQRRQRQKPRQRRRQQRKLRRKRLR